MRIKTNSNVDLLIFAAPVLILYILFFYTSLGANIYYSFTNWNGLNPRVDFVGFKNYIYLLKDGRFWYTFRFTLSFAALSLIATNILSMSLALLLNLQIRTRTALRTVIFSPYVLNLITIGFVWQFILGNFMGGLYASTGWGILRESILADSFKALLALVFVKVWITSGYFMVIYLAGLQNIPVEIIESARVDGAKFWRMLVHITLPMIMPSITVCTFMALVSSLNVFPLILTFTGGGPGYATESVALNIFREAFEFNQFGYGSAKALIYLLFLVIVSFIQMFFFKKREVVA